MSDKAFLNYVCPSAWMKPWYSKYTTTVKYRIIRVEFLEFLFNPTIKFFLEFIFYIFIFKTEKYFNLKNTQKNEIKTSLTSPCFYYVLLNKGKQQKSCDPLKIGGQLLKKTAKIAWKKKHSNKILEVSEPFN